MPSKRRRSESLPQTPVFQFTLDVRFPTDTEKKAFIARLDRVRDLFSTEGGEKVRNYELLSQLFSLAETRQLSQQNQSSVRTESYSTVNMLGSNGELSISMCETCK